MAFINQATLPIVLFEEVRTDTLMDQEMLRQEAQRIITETPALLLIGSMHTVNQKLISSRTDLCKSSSKDFVMISRQEVIQKQRKAIMDITDLEQKKRICYRERNKEEAARSTQKYERPMKIPDRKQSLVKDGIMKKSISSPVLVDLQHFPGFSEGAPPPLPNEVSLKNIIENVISAQSNAAGKELLQFLSTPDVQAILLGSFWWIFLQKYQPEPENQSLLFQSVADNYVHLLQEARSFLYGDNFLKAFPSVLSQAVYSCFCFSFPMSWHQFYTDDFKTMICNTIWEWIGGIRPLPGIYSSWNYSHLEPKNLRIEDRMQEKEKEMKYVSTSILSLEARKNSEGCLAGSSHRLRTRNISFSGLNHKRGSIQPASNGYSLNNLSLGSDLSRESVGLSKLLSLTDTKQTRFSVDMPHTLKVAEVEKPRSRKSNISKSVEMKYPSVRSHKESHPACRGPDFTNSVFNLNGLSPLVQNYLQRQNVMPIAGQDVLMQRTEVKNVIPSSVPTYSDLVRQGYKRLQALDCVLRNTYGKLGKDSLAFNHSLHEAKNELLRQPKTETK
uniref:Protein FAM227A isoform X2 n=1 Tax=Geotrypetes seraphini TaxID=260995 RepID=A0A6P8QDK3_GEOSA|nr:protein FAM227A isoform X2 [Geotrypetes seraphini]